MGKEVFLYLHKENFRYYIDAFAAYSTYISIELAFVGEIDISPNRSTSKLHRHKHITYDTFASLEKLSPVLYNSTGFFVFYPYARGTFG